MDELHVGNTEAGKLAGTVYREAVEYVPRELREVREDIETNRTSHDIYRKGYRSHKLESAEARGAITEQRHYREKVAKETDKFDREEARKGISLLAEKAYQIQRAKTSAIMAAKDARRQFFERQQSIISQQQFAQQSILQQRRLIPFYSIEGAKAIDPLGIFSLGIQTRPRQSQQQTFRQPQQQQPRPDFSHLNMLLGYSEKDGKRKKVLNLFTGIWE